MWDWRWVVGLVGLLGLGLVACADATGVPGAQGADVLYADGFVSGEMGNWVMEGDNAGQTAVINEQLVIELADNNMMQFATLADPIFDNFILEVDGRLLQGDQGSSYGVLFRMQDTTRFYRFEITGDGLFMVERRDGESGWVRFVDRWTETPAINQGLNSTNRLKVEALGQTITLYVNDIQVHQFSDTAYASGTIALDAGTFVQPQAQVRACDLLAELRRILGRGVEDAVDELHVARPFGGQPAQVFDDRRHGTATDRGALDQRVGAIGARERAAAPGLDGHRGKAARVGAHVDPAARRGDLVVLAGPARAPRRDAQLPIL